MACVGHLPPTPHLLPLPLSHPRYLLPLPLSSFSSQLRPPPLTLILPMDFFLPQHSSRPPRTVVDNSSLPHLKNPLPNLNRTRRFEHRDTDGSAFPFIASKYHECIQRETNSNSYWSHRGRRKELLTRTVKHWRGEKERRKRRALFFLRGN